MTRSKRFLRREQAIARFDLSSINPTAAALPYPKLEWLNGVYIREMDPAELQQQLAPFLAKQLGLGEAELRTSPRLAKLMPLVRERIKLLSEAWDKLDWAFVDAAAITYPDPQLLVGKGLTVADSVVVLQTGRELIRTVADFEAKSLEEAFRNAAEQANIKVGSYLAPFRVAITGRTVSPPLFESMEVLEREETQARVDNAIQALQAFAGEKV